MEVQYNIEQQYKSFDWRLLYKALNVQTIEVEETEASLNIQLID
jgi:hypothetical protein